ncbi:MAG: filamentous hemagglutinin N-terminal domain-containing protein [Janthinobacterium lividum]
MHFRPNEIQCLLPFCATLVAGACGTAWALPQGGQIGNGTGNISAPPGNAMVVTQVSPKLVINWASFGVDVVDSLTFNQPSRSAIVLNRVTGQAPSEILGSMTANGQVFVTNPNGIYFGQNARVNVGGLVAATGQLSDADFAAGRYRFTGIASGAGSGVRINNQGFLTASDQGYIALLGPQVINQGVITARLGTALLAAGNQVTLQFEDGSLIGYNIDTGALEALAENRTLIKADGGRVFMGAKAAEGLARAVVNNDGIIEALTVDSRKGVISLRSDGQTSQVSGNGKLDASATDNGDGGSIQTSAAQILPGNGATVTAGSAFGTPGSWVIEGATSLTASSTLGATVIPESLKTTNVTVSTAGQAGTASGDLIVEGALSFSPDLGRNTTLTLRADHDIRLQGASITPAAAERPGDLVLKSGASLPGAAVLFDPASRVVGKAVTLYTTPPSYAVPTDYSPFVSAQNLTTWLWLSNLADLQAVNTNPASLAQNYALSRSIDASDSAVMNGGAGFLPIGSVSTPFSGNFDGNGFTIFNLTINRPEPTTAQAIGLFGNVKGPSGTLISNLGLSNANITGATLGTGALAGDLDTTGVVNSHVLANSTVTGNQYTGGLVGNLKGNIERSYSEATVKGVDYTGGLAGNASGNLDQTYSTGPVTGNQVLGGLVGQYLGGPLAPAGIRNSYSTSTVAGNAFVGGLIGLNDGTVDNVYSASTLLTGNFFVGGLIGRQNQ